MICKVRHENDITVVSLGGRFDVVNAPQVKTELGTLIEDGNSKLVINLAKIDFVDSAGLGVLVSCLRRASAEGGVLRLAEVPAFCRSIFELTRLTRVFEVGQSEAEALKAIAESSGR